MSLGLVGIKRGMTRVFTEEGASIPVTVIEIEPNRVTQIRTAEKDGYDAVQITTGVRRANRVTRPAAGHFAKAGTEPGRGLWEFRVDAADVEGMNPGDVLPLETFEAGMKVDICGESKGKGFQGAVKRWNFRTQDATHGNSLSHRAPGSIGQCQTPGRVFKGKKMAGHLGAERVTTQNLEVVRVDVDRGLLLIKGAVPGAASGDVVVTPAVKYARSA